MQSSSRYWYFGPLKKYAAHWISTLRVRMLKMFAFLIRNQFVFSSGVCKLLIIRVFQEWPQVRDVSISYLAPTLRPPDLPPQKKPRPSLLNRIARRFKNYWYPPVEGTMC